MKKIVTTNKNYTYRRMCVETEILSNVYYPKCKVFSIGKSVQNRDILCFCIGKGKTDLLIVAAHHAREHISSTFAMATAERFLRKCSCADSQICRILENVRIHIIPMLNPDGVELAVKGASVATAAIKSMKKIHPGYETWKANANGVDLNRHYPCLFDEKYSCIDEPASELFKGKFPATAPEVRALMKYTQSVNFDLAATFHAKGEEIYWADDNTPSLHEITFPIARKLCKISGYKLMPPSSDPKIYGAGFENWFRATFLKPCILFELSPFIGGFIPHPPERFSELVWSKAKNIGLALAQEAFMLASERY